MVFKYIALLSFLICISEIYSTTRKSNNNGKKALSGYFLQNGKCRYFHRAQTGSQRCTPKKINFPRKRNLAKKPIRSKQLKIASNGKLHLLKKKKVASNRRRLLKSGMRNSVVPKKNGSKRVRNVAPFRKRKKKIMPRRKTKKENIKKRTDIKNLRFMELKNQTVANNKGKQNHTKVLKRGKANGTNRLKNKRRKKLTKKFKSNKRSNITMTKKRYRKTKSSSNHTLIYDPNSTTETCYYMVKTNGVDEKRPQPELACFHYKYADKSKKTCYKVFTTSKKIAPEDVPLEKCSGQRPLKKIFKTAQKANNQAEGPKYTFNPTTGQCEQVNRLRKVKKHRGKRMALEKRRRIVNRKFRRNKIVFKNGRRKSLKILSIKRITFRTLKECQSNIHQSDGSPSTSGISNEYCIDDKKGLCILRSTKNEADKSLCEKEKTIKKVPNCQSDQNAKIETKDKTITSNDSPKVEAPQSTNNVTANAPPPAAPKNVEPSNLIPAVILTTCSRKRNIKVVSEEACSLARTKCKRYDEKKIKIMLKSNKGYDGTKYINDVAKHYTELSEIECVKDTVICRLCSNEDAMERKRKAEGANNPPPPVEPQPAVPPPAVPTPTVPTPAELPPVRKPDLPSPVVPAPTVPVPAVPAPTVLPPVRKPDVPSPAVPVPVVPVPAVPAPTVPAPAPATTQGEVEEEDNDNEGEGEGGDQEVEECYISNGAKKGLCFKVPKVMDLFMKQSVNTIAARSDKLLRFGQKMMTESFDAIFSFWNEAKKSMEGPKFDSGQFLNAVANAVGKDKCEVIRNTLPLDDKLYHGIAEECFYDWTG